MRIRIKFQKYGVMRFIGHLDIMRYFQKSIRRAGIDITYSGGFSPHQIMSFAAPLGVGLCSKGEYLDIEVNSTELLDTMVEKDTAGSSLSCEQMKDALNQVMVEGISIVSLRRLPDTAGNAMASVAAARYLVEWKNEEDIPSDLIKKGQAFILQQEISITKQTKKNTLTLDIKPGIYEFDCDDTSVTMLVNASSSGNIKPSMVLSALYESFQETFDPLKVQITRLDTYYNRGNEETPDFAPLEAAGEIF